MQRLSRAGNYFYQTSFFAEVALSGGIFSFPGIIGMRQIEACLFSVLFTVMQREDEEEEIARGKEEEARAKQKLFRFYELLRVLISDLLQRKLL